MSVQSDIPTMRESLNEARFSLILTRSHTNSVEANLDLFRAQQITEHALRSERRTRRNMENERQGRERAPSLDQQRIAGTDELPEVIENARSLEGRESAKSNEGDSRYNFTPERRQSLLQQMHSEIAAYDAKRERAFGREHGYEVYPSTPEVKRKKSISSERREWNTNMNNYVASGGSESGGGSPLGGARLPIEDVEENPDRTQNPSPTFPPLTRTGAVQRPLNNWSNDPVNDFLIELCSTGHAWNFDTGPRFPPLTFNGTDTAAGRVYSAFYTTFDEVFDGVPIHDSTANERIWFNEMTETMQNSLLRIMIRGAVEDGMDIREAMPFLREWGLFMYNRFEDPFPKVNGMLYIRDMQFWAALRNG